ncbi:hypothetical protein V2G26_006148 [Clonostachys chloroleuca]
MRSSQLSPLASSSIESQQPILTFYNRGISVSDSTTTANISLRRSRGLLASGPSPSPCDHRRSKRQKEVFDLSLLNDFNNRCAPTFLW